jgi:hypothetical protein
MTNILEFIRRQRWINRTILSISITAISIRFIQWGWTGKKAPSDERLPKKSLILIINSLLIVFSCKDLL